MRSKINILFLILVLFLSACRGRVTPTPKVSPAAATQPPAQVSTQAALATAGLVPEPQGRQVAGGSRIFLPHISSVRSRTSQFNVGFSIPSLNSPSVVIYAVAADGSYYTMDAAYTGQNATYLLPVPPGEYQVYARSSVPNDPSYFGVWLQSGGQARHSVPDGGALSVALTPPPNPCEAVFWLPASPDGRFSPVANLQGPLGCLKPTAQPTATMPSATARLNIRFNLPGASYAPSTIIYAVNLQGGFYPLAIPSAAPGTLYVLSVPPGSYQVYARSTLPGDISFFGAWAVGGGLSAYSVVHNGQIDIPLAPPPDRCNPAYWLPASPDGVFQPVSAYQQQMGCLNPTQTPTPVYSTARLNVRFNAPSSYIAPTMIYAISAQGNYYLLSAPSAVPGTLYTILVPPGTYQVYARATTPGDLTYYGAWNWYGGLAGFTLGADGALDVGLTYPPNVCDPNFGLPASPDGRFSATADFLPQLGCQVITPTSTRAPTSTPAPTNSANGQLTVSFSIPSMSPPPVMIYVVGLNGTFYPQQAPLTGIGASYVFQLPPGDYQVYARSTLPGDSSYFGFWSSAGLGWLAVPRGWPGASTVLAPPPNACSPVYALPGSPDGLFPPVGGGC